MEAYHEVEKVYFILDGDDDPVQEVELNDLLVATNDSYTEESWDGVAR